MSAGLVSGMAFCKCFVAIAQRAKSCSSDMRLVLFMWMHDDLVVVEDNDEELSFSAKVKIAEDEEHVSVFVSWRSRRRLLTVTFSLTGDEMHIFVSWAMKK